MILNFHLKQYYVFREDDQCIVYYTLDKSAFRIYLRMLTYMGQGSVLWSTVLHAPFLK